MKIYQGSPLFLYSCLKQNYKNIFGNTKGLTTFNDFKQRMEQGKEIHFAGCLYTITKK
jgi:hypothetical protein